jgi:hypothetical protein
MNAPTDRPDDPTAIGRRWQARRLTTAVRLRGAVVALCRAALSGRPASVAIRASYLFLQLPRFSAALGVPLGDWRVEAAFFGR